MSLSVFSLNISPLKQEKVMTEEPSNRSIDSFGTAIISQVVGAISSANNSNYIQTQDNTPEITIPLAVSLGK